MREDYLLRLIEDWFSLWRRLVRLSDFRDYETSLEEIDKTYGQMFGYNATFIDHLPDDDLFELAKHHGTIAHDRCFVLASLLTAEGDQYAGLHSFDESYWRYERAVLLWQQLVLSGHQPDQQTRDGMLNSVEKLQHYSLSRLGGSALLDVLSALGSYAKAEDVLYEWLAISEYNQEAVERAEAWYQRMHHVNEDDLIAGDLLPQDIIEGLAQVRELAQQATTP